MAPQRLRSAWFYLKFLAATIVVTVLSLILVSAVLITIAFTIPLKFPVCCETPARFGASYEPMRFTTSDGLTLSGWYVPPRNQVVIILLHSYYADRRQTLPVAEMLYEHGYGLLLYDQRASGESEGNSRSLGWRDIADVSSAAGWLVKRQGDVKIGAYGCSVGGAIALAGAVGVPSIRAIAVDAPSPLQWDENMPRFSLRDPLSLPLMALYYPLVMLRANALPPTSTLQAVKDYGTRPILFISTGQSDEYLRISAYYDAAGGPKEQWNIPGASHCGGPAVRPEEYQQHLVNFFDSAMR